MAALRSIALLMLVATPATAQLSVAGFVPALVPHTAQQPFVINAGWADWNGAGGPVGRADYWFGRFGAAASVGSVHSAGETRVNASLAALLEILPQGVGLLKPGVQLQAGYTADVWEDGSWSIPLALGVLLHAPPPLSNRAHALITPALSIRQVIAGSDDLDGTSGGFTLRIVFDDRAGFLTMWGVYGYARLASSGADRGPRWEAAITRVLRKPARNGG
jgi:hypothetical protein